MKYSLLLWMTVFTGQLFAQNYTVDFKMNNQGGIYKKDEKIVVSAQLLDEGKPVKGKRLRYILYHDKKQIMEQDGSADGPITIDTSMDHPGWCTVLIIGMDVDGKVLAFKEGDRQRQAYFEIGALVDPLELEQGAPAPEDFAEFWNEQKTKLRAIPMNVKFKPIQGTPSHRKAHLVTVDCGNGIRPVNGILHIPANVQPKSLPIYLFVHGAGVHNPPDFQWAPPGRGAATGASIFFNLNAHGLPQDRPLSFYKELRDGELKNYPFLNSADHDHYYMKGMIVRLIRALEFLKTLPEWNGKDIVMNGGSQGGAQVLFAAGVDPQVSEIYADVPAMCDLGASLVNRVSGWPQLYYKQGGKIMLNQDYDPNRAKPGDESMIRTAGYFDVANFAKQIKCKTYIRTGGADGVCPPTGVFVVYNNIPSSDKEIDFSPLGGHCQGVYEDTANIKMAKYRGIKRIK